MMIIMIIVIIILISQSPLVQAVLRLGNLRNTCMSQAPTFSNRWLWRPSVPSTQPASITFFSEQGRRWTDVSGDPRATSYLFQRVSLAAHRYSSMAFRGTFSVPTEMNWTGATQTCDVLKFYFKPRHLNYQGIKIRTVINKQTRRAWQSQT